jgi:arsenite methyltransferase
MSSCDSKPADERIKDSVKDYYGKRLKTTDDLQTSVCTHTCGKVPAHIRDALKMCHDEVVSK